MKTNKTVNYKGKGEHSVRELELIIEQQSEELHLIKSGQKQLPIQNIMASVSDELLLRAGKYEDEANADFDTDGVQHNLNIGRYDGLMQAVQELNKHLP